MMDLQRFSPKFSPKLMALSIMATTGLVVQPAFALEKLDDTALAAKTGEGIGFVVEDLKVVADQNAYVRITSAGGSPIPANAPPNTKKAEIYMYGLSVGAEDGTTGNTVAGANIGSVDNPIVLTTKAQQGDINTGVMSVKLPSVADGSHPANSNAGNNLKAVTWVDVLPRTAANDSFASPADYLRMQAMANKFSLNGTEVHFHKTGNFSAGAAVTTGVADFDNAMAAERTRMEQAYSHKVANYGKLRINYETDTNAATKDTLQNSGYFRWSVAQATAGSNPAVGNSTNPQDRAYGAAVTATAPTFDAKEGLYVKDFQINMPLGSSFQPTIIDTDAEGNLTLEVARIPNIQAIYDRQYVNYNKLENGTAAEKAAEKAKFCTPTSCPDTATHATAYFRTFTLNKAGEANPTSDPSYRGYGIKGAADGSGASGISTGGITPYAANTAPTYNMAEGLVVNHLKVTLNK